MTTPLPHGTVIEDGDGNHLIVSDDGTGGIEFTEPPFSSVQVGVSQQTDMPPKTV